MRIYISFVHPFFLKKGKRKIYGNTRICVEMIYEMLRTNLSSLASISSTTSHASFASLEVEPNFLDAARAAEMASELSA